MGTDPLTRKNQEREVANGAGRLQPEKGRWGRQYKEADLHGLFHAVRGLLPVPDGEAHVAPESRLQEAESEGLDLSRGMQEVFVDGDVVIGEEVPQRVRVQDLLRREPGQEEEEERLLPAGECLTDERREDLGAGCCQRGLCALMMERRRRLLKGGNGES